MSDPVRRRMTSDAFIAWAMEQPETSHYELVAGEVVAMAPERSVHALTKAQIWHRMAEEVEAIPQGDVADFRNFMGAVIDGNAYSKHMSAIEFARKSESASRRCQQAERPGHHRRGSVPLHARPRCRRET